MTRQSQAIALGSVTVLSWATVATAFKIALLHLSVYEMVIIATATAMAVFALVLTIGKKWRELKKLQRRDFGLLALMGLFNPTAYYLVLFKGYDMLPAQIAQPVNYLWPIVLLVLLALFDRQAIPLRKYIGMAVSLSGLVCISFGGRAITGSLSISGIGILLFSALLWASYWMLNQRFKDRSDSTLALFCSFGFGLIYLLAAMPFTRIGTPDTEGILSGLYIGCFEMGIPFVCFGMALRLTTNPTLINQMCYLAPFLSLFFISTVLDEPIIPSTYVGLLLIVGGIVYNQYFASSNNKALEPEKS